MTADAAAKAREHFPRGLVQPEAGFRFSADTLLLGAFARVPAARGGPARGLDLGCGCGAAGFALALLGPAERVAVTGIDADAAMVAAARENAERLGLARSFRFEHCLAEAFSEPGRFDFALANPPFHDPAAGRVCLPERRAARFEAAGGLSVFAECAARCLRTRGRFFLVHLAARLAGVLRVLEDADLAPKRVLPVQGRAGQPPRLVLVEAVRAGATGLSLLSPLALYDAEGALSAEAAAFCPHLRANPRRGAASAAMPLANAGTRE